MPIFTLPFCGPNEIRYISVTSLLSSLSFSDTHTNQFLLFYMVDNIAVVTILIVLISYSFILLAILRTHSAKGRQKVLCTCGSHLTRVFSYHGTILFMYMRPSPSHGLEHDMVVSLFYTIVIPLLSPIVHSLRSKNMKEIMRIFIKRN